MSERNNPVERVPSREDKLKRAVGVAALATGALTGGIIGMSASSTSVETSLYRADINVLWQPEDTAHLDGWTNAGSIQLNFDSVLPPPGVKLSVQVKETAFDVFKEDSISLASFKPSNDELHEIESNAITQLAAKFGLGVASGEAVALLLLMAGNNPLLRRKLVAGTAMLGVGLGVTAGMGLNFYQTYGPDNFSDYKTTEVLGLLEANSSMLSDVEDRLNRSAPYVKNLLLFSEALKKEFTPPELDRPAVTRFLLVSDIHGVNQYELMNQIIAEKHITAVIDSGDMLNFGSVTEAEAAGIFASIEKLTVPYIFVDGNHDAMSEKDQALLERLKKTKNVILLQDNNDYNVVSVNGVTVAGMNDPRYATDDGKNTKDKQQPSIEAFEKTFEDRPTPHIVVMHEPAVEDIEKADVTINGHMHEQLLKDNRIGVGTYTGAGIVSHFRQGIDENGNGQPSSFDILSYGDDCTPTSLNRVLFNGALHGDLTYQESTINGNKLGVEAREGAICDESIGVTVERVKSKMTPKTITPQAPGRTMSVLE